MTETAGGVRAFLALPADAEWLESAGELVARLRPEIPEVSWARPESCHLTLRFLGELLVPAITGFMAEVAGAAAQTPAAVLATDRALLFPAHGPPRVLAVGFAPGPGPDAVTFLAEQAEQAARRLGLEPEKRSFRPHVTLGRSSGRCPRAAVERYRTEVGDWDFPLWQARRCVLYESRLDPGGAVHTLLAEWDLAGTVRTEASA